MSFLYFLGTVFIAWTAYNLYHPAEKNIFLMITSTFFGVLVGEFTLHVLILEMLYTLFHFGIGSLDGFFGGLGLALTIGSWITMLIFFWHSRNVQTDVEEGIKRTLGREYRDKIRHEVTASFDEKTTFRRIIQPWPVRSPDVELLKNIVYARAGQTKMRLDIYRGKEESAKRPVLMQIHGGAWTERFGSKREQAIPLMSYLAEKGWLCVSISYRVAPRSPFPACIIDCKKALSWIKENIEEYGGDPGFVAVTGGGAGGHLASLLALTANDPVFQPGFEKANTEVQACVPFYGYYDFTDANELHKHDTIRTWARMMVMQIPRYNHLEEYQNASPLFRVHSKAPPFLVIHGASDRIAPLEEASHFVEELSKVSESPAGMIEVSNAQHGFNILPSPRSEYVHFGVHRFLSALHCGYREKQDL